MKTDSEDINKEILTALQDIRKAAILEAKDFLNAKECALLTDMSTDAIYSLCKRREMPHYKRGGKLYFSKKEIEHWIKENPIKTNEQIEREAETYITLKKMKIRQ